MIEMRFWNMLKSVELSKNNKRVVEKTGNLISAADDEKMLY